MNVFIVLLIVIIIFIFIFYLNNLNEKFDDIINIERTPSYLNDALFDDIIPYENDEEGRLGLDKCLEYCNGTCLEYGITGNANCFPQVNEFGSNYNTVLPFFADLESDYDDVERAGTNLVYPSMR